MTDTTAMFDEHGMPTGDTGTELIDIMLDHVLTAVDADGWDRPHSLWHITPPVVVASSLPDAGASLPGPAYGLQRISDLDDLDLVGQHAPASVVGVVVVMESWVRDYGDHRSGTGREAKIVTALTRSGSIRHTFLTRDGQPILSDGGGDVALAGPLLAFLYAYLGAPVPPAPLIGPFLGHMVLNYATQASNDGLTGPGIPAEVNETLTLTDIARALVRLICRGINPDQSELIDQPGNTETVAAEVADWTWTQVADAAGLDHKLFGDQRIAAWGGPEVAGWYQQHGYETGPGAANEFIAAVGPKQARGVLKMLTACRWNPELDQ